MCRICCQGIKIRKVGTQPLDDFRQRIWKEFEGFKKTGLGGQCSFNFIISANNMKKIQSKCSPGFLVVQWLGFGIFTAVTQVHSHGLGNEVRQAACCSQIFFKNRIV